MWKIKDVEIKSYVVLGPMAGITFLSYREFMKPFGVGLSVSEMVSDCGLIYNNKLTLDYIKTSQNDSPIAIQLFGSSSKTICQAIDIVLKHNPNIDFIDINLGCPVPKVTKTGAGSALLKDPINLKKMMTEIVEHSSKPITAKIRLGWNDDSINVLENVKALEEAGVSAIAIHARTTTQGYGGKARYDLIKNLGAKMKVPLIISGDIFSLEDAIKAKEITKATAIMVARGAVGNPYLITQIDEYFKTGKILPKLSRKDNIINLLKLTDMVIEEKGEYRAMSIMRGIAPKFLNDYPNSKSIKNEMAQTLVTKQSLLNIVSKINNDN